MKYFNKPEINQAFLMIIKFILQKTGQNFNSRTLLKEAIVHLFFFGIFIDFGSICYVSISC